jgi:hypothetical protein
MRTFHATLLVLVGTTTLHAAPPTAEDWWTAMGRYPGHHLLKDGETGAVVGAFEVEWGVPFERINYRYSSIGDGPETTATGFCSWDEKLGKVRFVEVETGADGLVTHLGTLEDVEGTAYTWNVRTWSEKEEIRSFTITDVFNGDGVDRSIEMKSGSAIPSSFVWTRVNHFQKAFPLAEQLVGIWNFADEGQQKMAKVEWGPGKNTLVETTYSVGDDGKTTADSTVVYMYDTSSDVVRMHFMGADGTAGWASPRVGTADGKTTMEVSWRGRNANGDRLTAEVLREIDGDTMTLTMRDFTFERVSFPEGDARSAMTTPTVMTRAKK